MDISFTKLINILIKKLDRWLEASIKMLPNIILAVIIFIIFYASAKTIKSTLEKILNRFSENRAVNRLIGTGVYLLLSGIGLFISLGILQLDKAVTSLLAGAGVIGLALGFAFQEIASNFISGILIAFTKPYKLGDIVEVGEYVGEVQHITLRTTSIETYQGLEVLVPNKEMFTKTMVNYSSTPKRRIDLNVGVSYSSDLPFVEKVTKEALEEISGRIPSMPIDVFFKEFSDSSINFTAQIWVRYPGHRAYYQSVHECIISIKKHFDENGINIPFPIRTIDLNLAKPILKELR
ncbi:MAG: mechanosensitive ion channel family protein [Halobacteriovoraceae bacterium]|nr:mechanosensitive ion channel family protein [Halobacteriovoraceae bacterium]